MAKFSVIKTKSNLLDPREALHLEKKWNVKNRPTLLYTNCDVHFIFGRLAMTTDQLKALRETFGQWESDPYLDWEEVDSSRIINVREKQLN